MCGELGKWDHVKNRDSRLYKTIININHMCLGRFPPRVKESNLYGLDIKPSVKARKKC